MHFLWHSFNISHYLIDQVGPDWESQLIQFALQNVNVIKLSPTNTTSREDEATHELQNAVVDGTKIRKHAPWLFDLYRTKFRDFAEMATQKPAICAREDVYAINLNVQIGNRMRYECHVDSNPIQGMLYVTSHPVGQGGDLVVSNQHDVFGVEEVNKDFTTINPQAGLLVFFDARRHSHYVRPLVENNDVRVAIAMNFYTEESPEGNRPPDLSKHLGLE